MRTLTLLLALSTTAMVACSGSEDEICDDGLDNDGDGLVDTADSADCPTLVEDCTNGTDDDGDGLVDYDDTDDCTAPAEVCDDGIDNDLDGATDCDDSDCDGVQEPCLPQEAWTFYGEGTVTSGTSYAGTVLMGDYVTRAYNGTATEPTGTPASSSNADVLAWLQTATSLCEARYVHTSSGAPTTACADCEWAFAFGPAPLDTTFGTNGYVGSACDSWYDFTDDTAQNYFGEWDFFDEFGFNADYATSNGTYSLMMFFYDANGYTGWYALPALAEYDSTSGAHNWLWIAGYYEY